MRFVAILSPAKALDLAAKGGPAELSSPRFAARTAELVRALKGMTKGDLKKMYKVSDAIAALNAERFANFEEQSSYPAAWAFNGPAWVTPPAVASAVGPTPSASLTRPCHQVQGP